MEARIVLLPGDGIGPEGVAPPAGVRHERADEREVREEHGPWRQRHGQG